MKKILLTLLTFVFFNILSTAVYASDNNNFAVGVISEDKLLNNYSDFHQNYQAYSLSAQEQNLVAQWPETLKVEVFFGTWCHDSEREVPKLIKILKANKSITPLLIALDHQKQDPEQLAKENRVKYTPTIIIYRDASKKEELGRIVERPKKSLVTDINQFLK